jgi:hypothetical protein
VLELEDEVSEELAVVGEVSPPPTSPVGLPPPWPPYSPKRFESLPFAQPKLTAAAARASKLQR